MFNKEPVSPAPLEMTVNILNPKNDNIRKNNKNLISFACNDYLGLSHNSSLKKSAILAIKKYGVAGSGYEFIRNHDPRLPPKSPSSGGLLPMIPPKVGGLGGILTVI